MSRAPNPRTPWRRLFGVLVTLAVAVRVLFLVELRGASLVGVLLGDAAYFHAWAVELAAGRWLGSEPFFQAPLYPYGLGALYSLVGAEPWVVRCLQAVAGGLAAGWVALGTLRLFGRREAWAAGLILALYAPSIWFVALLQKGSLTLALASLLFWLCARYATGGAGARGGLAIGLVTGLFVLTRQNALLLLPALAAGVWSYGGEGRRRGLLWFAGGVLCALAPALVRNGMVLGELTISSANGGVNFYQGNHAGADGLYQPLLPGRGHPDFESADARDLAMWALGRELTSSEVSRYWYARAWSDIREDPARWLALLARKVRLSLHGKEAMDVEAMEAYERESRWLWGLGRVFHFGLVLPLALVGIVFGCRRGQARLWGLALGGLLWLGAVLFLVTARFRLAYVPFLVPFAASGLLELFRLRGLSRWAACILAGGALLFSNLPIDVGGNPLATTQTNLALAYLVEGDLEAAHRASLEAVRLDPNEGGHHFVLGRVEGSRGDAERAQASFAQALITRPDLEASIESWRGAFGLRRGDPTSAVEHLARAVELDPYRIDARHGLGLAYRQLGRYEQAERAYLDLLELRPAHVETLHNLGYLYEGTGQSARALESYRRAIEADPDFLPSLGRRAWMLSTLPDPSLRDGQQAVALARHALEVQPDSISGRDALAAAYAEVGRMEDAVSTLEELLDRPLSDETYRTSVEQRLESYRRGEPWRDRR